MNCWNTGSSDSCQLTREANWKSWHLCWPFTKIAYGIYRCYFKIYLKICYKRYKIFEPFFTLSVVIPFSHSLGMTLAAFQVCKRKKKTHQLNEWSRVGFGFFVLFWSTRAMTVLVNFTDIWCSHIYLSIGASAYLRLWLLL